VIPRRAAAAALGCVLGCAGSALGPAEIPDAPVALHWRDAATARRHAELLEAREAAGEAARRREGVSRSTREGVAHLDDITGYLKHLAGFGRELPSESDTAGRLALLDPRSGDLTPIEAALPDAIPVAWAERGRRLLFSQFEGEFRQLYELDLARGEVRRVTRGPNAHARGCFLPDGSLVASSAGSEVPAGGGASRFVSRIVRTPPGGAEPEALSAGPADHSPACASDGRAVVWVSRGDGGREWLMSRAPLDAPPRRLGPGRDPAFSPDGQWVIYAAPERRSWRILRVRPDGTGRAPVGETDLEEQQPAFSPDGRLALIVVHDEYARRLHLRRIDGSGDRILFEDGDAEFPVW
jgi:dipeptidyl aminopeptidase/acylaminoacyl peptidase